MKLLNQFLKNNPDLVSKYVAVGYNLLGKTIQPLNRVMIHLLEVQGIDPNTRPGEATRKNLAVAVEQIAPIAEEEFEPDFNFSAIKGFEKVSKQLSHLKLSHENFRKVTDLSLAQDTKQLELAAKYKTGKVWNPVTKTVEENKVTTPDNSVEDLKAFMDKYDVDTKELFVAKPVFNADTVRDALSTIKKYADKLQSDDKEVVEVKRQPVSIGSPKRTKTKAKAFGTHAKKGVFRRVED